MQFLERIDLGEEGDMRIRAQRVLGPSNFPCHIILIKVILFILA
jgi:hypothetical protein